MDAERIDRWCERGIFGLVLFILVFSPLAFGAVRTFEFVYVQVAAIGIALLWLVRCWVKHVFEVFWPPICWPVLLFVIYAVTCYFMADLEYLARGELMKVLVYAVVFLAVVNNLQRQEYLQIIWWTLIGLATLIALYGLFQFATNATKVWHFKKPPSYIHRGSGTFINPNHLAGYLEMILPLGLAMIWLGRISHVSKIILGYACALIVVGIGISLSRGGWISTSLMLFCFFVLAVFHTRNRWIVISAVVVLFVGAAFYMGSSLQFQNRFRKTFAGGKVEDSRFDYWKPAIQMWKENPYIGVGPGHFDERFAKYRPIPAQSRPQYAHNDYLNTLAEWGAIGLAIILGFLVCFYLGLLQAAKNLRRKVETGEGKSNRAAFVFGSGFSILGLLFHSVTDFNMQIPSHALSLVAICALAMTQLRYSEKFWMGNKVLVKLLPTIVLVGVIGFAGFYTVRQIRENSCLYRAQTSTFDRKVAALKAAFAIEPNNYSTAYTLGQVFREASFRGETGYEKYAEEAIIWFERAAKLNPFSPYNYLGWGMCLDWLGRKQEAERCFDKALELDPNSHYTVAYQGWHRVQLEDYAGAQKWFEKSLGLSYNHFADSYLGIVRQKMAEAAAEKR